MTTLTISVPSYADIKAKAVEVKDDAVAIAKHVYENPKVAAEAVKAEVVATSKSGRFWTGVAAGLTAAVAVKHIVS